MVFSRLTKELRCVHRFRGERADEFFVFLDHLDCVVGCGHLNVMESNFFYL